MLSNLTLLATLKSIASDMGIRVPSKARKAEIIDLILAEIDVLHGEAIDENRKRVVSKIAAGYAASVKREGKSYTQRMISRCEGYARQNGNEYSGFIGDMIARFTPAQRRRYNKKVRSFAASQS